MGPQSPWTSGVAPDSGGAHAATQDGATRLYDLLDSLVALRLEFSDGVEGEQAIAKLGRAKVGEVHTVLDAAIINIRQIIAEVNPPLAAMTLEASDRRRHPPREE